MPRIPNVEDSPIWRATAPFCPDPTFDEALVVVLTVGDSLRKCGRCQSPATTIVALQYDHMEAEGGIFARLRETCADCDGEHEYHVPMGWWAAIEAMGVWEQGRTAKAAIALELEQRADLEALDKSLEIPVALQFCLACKRWVESRDGKAPCICAKPDIVKG